jgi:phosphoserine phosphatase
MKSTLNMPYVITLISAPDQPIITDQLVAAVSNLTGVPTTVDWLQPAIAADIFLEGTVSPAPLLQRLIRLLAESPVDYALQSTLRRKKQVLIADMDSTMIQQECIDELADYVGVKPQVADITARAMAGDIEFEPALRERVALLKGLDVATIDDVLANRIHLNKGSETLVSTMAAHGSYCALVSGGFTHFTKAIAMKLGFHENRANRLLTNSGKLTGKVAEPILGAQAKVDALNEIVATREVAHRDALAVGDGANDLGMIRLAGMGVALHAKPLVAAEADISIRFGDLSSLLFLQGYRIDEFVK